MLKEIYTKPVLEGYEITIEDAKTDYETYKILSTNGLTLTPEQTQRYTDLKAIFEPSNA